MVSPVYDTIIRVEEEAPNYCGSTILRKSIMQAQQLRTQLSPVENLYALLLYIFMVQFRRSHLFVSVLSPSFN